MIFLGCSNETGMIQDRGTELVKLIHSQAAAS